MFKVESLSALKLRTPCARGVSRPTERVARDWALKSSLTLRIQSTKTWGIFGFYSGNCSTGFENILCIWVLGPLGYMEVCMAADIILRSVSGFFYVLGMSGV